MVHLVAMSLALVAMTTIPGARSYGAEGGVYQQLAKALWQLQMKGDINTALQHTEIWTEPTPSLRPGVVPRGLVRPGGLVVRPIDIDERLAIPPQGHLNTPDPSKSHSQPAGNFHKIKIRPGGLQVRPIHVEEHMVVSPPQIKVQPDPVIRPIQSLAMPATDRQVAFARRSSQRQVTLRPVTEVPEKEIAPERIYSNKMDRGTAKGYGSSLTKLIAKKIKFDPTPEPDRPSNPIIDSILGPVAQLGSPVLPGNFVPLPSTPKVPQRAQNTPATRAHMGVNIQRPVVGIPVEKSPLIVLQQDRQTNVPSPSFSIVTSERRQRPSSFRFNNKEINSNQVQDKNSKIENSGFENFKDVEINDGSQVIVDQQPTLPTVKPIVAKEQVVEKSQGLNVERARVETIKDKKPQQPVKAVPVPLKPKQTLVKPNAIKVNKVVVSRSDVAIDNSPAKEHVGVQGATVTRIELQRPQIKAVQSDPVLTATREDVITSTQATGKDQTFEVQTDAPIESIDLTTEEPTFSTAEQTSTMWSTPTTTTTTVAPAVRVGISRGSPRGRRPTESFRGIRPSSRGRRPTNRGFSSVSRGPSRGVRPIGVRSQRPVVLTPENIPEGTPPTFTSFNDDVTTTLSPTTHPVKTEATTRPPPRQVPAMDTAQFARRARPGRVVVSTTNNQNPRQSTNQGPVISRGVEQRPVPVRAMEAVPIPSNRLSFDRAVAVEAPVLEPVILNAAGPAVPSTSATPVITATEQPPTTTTADVTTTAAPTRRPGTSRRPGMMSPEEKRQAQRNFQG
uniref:Flocculation protein FLO11-like n=1 Tax=Crassostrea virginica TaxID=6565 RepID=A0A8B8E5R0_CRAVI|nr:flocculation protein FLO11-like [Crassostrea virginica]